MNGRALMELLKAESDPKAVSTTETLAATLCLKAFEVCYVSILAYLITSV